MKIRRLPEIDLARIAPLPVHLQRKALNQIRDGFPEITYNPFRLTLPDIVNEQHTILGPTAPTPWSKIKTQITNRSTSDKERDANIAVAKCVFDFCEAEEVKSRREDFIPLSLSTGIKVRFWTPNLLIFSDNAVVPFFDPRRTRGLTRDGRKFVLSMMHERIRVTDPDYSEVRLGVFQFGNASVNARSLKVHFDEGVDLYTAEDLQEMVQTTYAIWSEILEGRRDIERKRGGESGSLL